jgi:hypothetical protein
MSERAPAVVPVTADTFVRAETDRYFAGVVQEGGFGVFTHRRAPAAIDQQSVVRLNRDTLYSAAVVDLEAGPATAVLPDAGGRFMSLQIIDQDEYTPAVHYGAGRHPFTREQIGTRYLLFAVRTLVDPADATDVAAVHALQDALTIEQPGGPGRFEVPAWDPASQTAVRDALLVLAATLPDTRGMFGPRGQVDPVRRFIGAAAAWGGNPERDATYLNVTPARNDGATPYRLTVTDVPVDGFWSISVYNAAGYFQPNDRDAYTLNNLTAVRAADGAIVVQFGGEPDPAANYLPVPPGWNYMVRLYRPRAEILEGRWTFPEAQPAG